MLLFGNGSKSGLFLWEWAEIYGLGRGGHIVEVGVGMPQRAQLRGMLHRRWYSKVTLIEPRPECAAALKLAFGQFPEVNVIEAAVTGVRGTVEMYRCGECTYIDNVRSPATECFGYIPKKDDRFAVEAISIADIDDGNINLLAADVEGSEWYVLDNLKSIPKMVVLECQMKPLQFENEFSDRIADWLDKHGYSCVAGNASDKLWVRV